jgi:hypothetical protein
MKSELEQIFFDVIHNNKKRVWKRIIEIKLSNPKLNNQEIADIITTEGLGKPTYISVAATISRAIRENKIKPTIYKKV